MKKNLSLIILTSILVLGFLIRLYRFDNPIADWHSWRQADTSAVSRYFVQHGYDILHPHFEDISNIPSGLENPQGYRFVEFPIYNVLQAGLYQVFGVLTLEEWGRIVTIIASLATSVFLYLLVKKYASELAGLLTAFFYTFLPYSIYYGRTILPDTSAIMAAIGAVYFFDKWIEESQNLKVQNSKPPKKNKKYIVYYLLAAVFAASSLLLKPFAGFFLLPIIVLVFRRFGWGVFKRWELYLFAIVTLLPVGLWRLWMTQWPEGIPANAWLFNGGSYRFKPFYFRWIYYERLTKLILGFGGLLPFVIGLVVIGARRFAVNKNLFGRFFLYSFPIASLLYVTVVARGNVQHDYYQILIIPSIAMFLGIGGAFLIDVPVKSWQRYRVVTAALFIIFSVVGIGYGWQQVRYYFDINEPAIVAAGQAVDKLTPKDAKVIAPLDGDTSLLYQTNRQGWPAFEHSIEKMIALGADYLVLPNASAHDRETYPKQYRVVAETPEYLLVNLREKP